MAIYYNQVRDLPSCTHTHTCNVSVQMNASNLKDRDLWAAGWLQKSQMEDPAGAAAAGVTCRACSGSGTTPCPVCDATGAVLRPPSGLSHPAALPTAAETAGMVGAAAEPAQADVAADGRQEEERAAVAGAAAREAAGQGQEMERGGPGSRAGSVLGRGPAGGGRNGLQRGPSPGAGGAARLAGLPQAAPAPAGRLGASDFTSGA